MFCGGFFVPNIASAEKRVRVIERKTLRNKFLKSALKTAWKEATDSVNSFDSNSGGRSKLFDCVKKAVKKMDQCVSKGVIHKNTANSKKSRLMQKYNFAIED